MEQLVIDVYGTLIDEAGEWLVGAVVVYWLGKVAHLWLQIIWSKPPHTAHKESGNE